MVDASTIEPTPTPSSTPTPTPLSGVDITTAASSWNGSAVFSGFLEESSSCSGTFAYENFDLTGATTSNHTLNPCKHSGFFSGTEIDPLGDAFVDYLKSTTSITFPNSQAWAVFSGKQTFIDGGKLYVSI
jgi:hypothetical protein